jgi:hypothetical protein
MGRGPSYPYVDLEGAIAYTRKVYDFAKRGSAATEAVVKDGLKLSPTSSGSQKVIAALRAFGLIEDAPGANGKAVKVSNSAIRILLDDPDSAQRQDEIKKAALSPKWYEYCWAKWGKDMPPAMRSNLLIEHGFVESTVDGFLDDYRKTIAFAGLLDDVIFKKEEQSTDESKNRLKVGDFVQWEVQGDLKLPSSRKILSFLDDGKYATVEGYPTNPIPIAELITAEPPEQRRPDASTLIPSVTIKAAVGGDTKVKSEIFSLSEGVNGQLHWPSVMTQDAYDDFLYYLEGLKRKVIRAVPKDKDKSDADETKAT